MIGNNDRHESEMSFIDAISGKTAESAQPNSAFLVRLKQSMPEFFTEEGFDIEKFQRNLKASDINETTSGYSLEFVGKSYAQLQTGQETKTVVVPNKKHNGLVQNDASENLFLSGDNLDVLKHLQKTYTNAIDFIYIDPPYNTGFDGFIYNDKFDLTDEQLRESLGFSEDEISRLHVINNRNSHSAWLTFMYPRLKIAQRLLNEKGVIFVSIDDNEQANLKLLLDEIFGEANFVTDFIWEKTQHFGRQKLNYYNNADHILVYAKNAYDDGKLREVLVEYEKSEFEDAPLYNDSNNVNVLKFKSGTVKFNIPDGVYTQTTDEKYVLVTPVTVVDGVNATDFALKFKSRWTDKTVQEEVEKGTRFWVKTKNFAIRAIYADGKVSRESPRQIIFTNQRNPAKTSSRLGERIDVSENASDYLEKLLGGAYFSYPKPVSLIKYLLSLYYDVDKGYEKSFTVLDFFAGSATTAEAVMQLNANDGGHRKFILATLDESTLGEELDLSKEKNRKLLANTPENFEEIDGRYYAKSDAYRAGFDTIDKISVERIKKAANRLTESGNDNFDAGFKHFFVKEIQQESLETLTDFDGLSLNLFDDMISPFSAEIIGVEGGASGHDTILQTWMLADGYPFSTKLERIDMDGQVVDLVDDARLYIIDNGWQAKNTKALINKIGTHQINVQTVVVYGHSFSLESMREFELALSQLDQSVNLLKRY